MDHLEELLQAALSWVLPPGTPLGSHRSKKDSLMILGEEGNNHYEICLDHCLQQSPILQG